MKRKSAIIVILILTLLVFAFLKYARPMLGILSGYAAKNMCSCVFVAGMDEERVKDEDLNFSYLRFADIEVDRESKKVKSSVFGMQEKTAVYRDHLGCALVSPESEENIYRFKSDWPSERYDSLINWFDSKDTLSLLSESSVNKVRKLVSDAFHEEGGTVKNTRAAVVLINGKIIAEHYAEGFDQNSRFLGWSMTKSLTSTIFGLMQKDGMVNLKETVPVSSWQEDGRSSITWENLLHMSSGLKFSEVYSFVSDATLMLYESDNMGAYAESLPLENPPGEVWYYSSGTSNIIAYNLAQSFDNLESYELYPYKQFFYKIGAYSVLMETDAGGYFVGSSYSWATARDWARIGQVYLQDGVWEGKQVVPSEWIDFVRTPVPDSGNDYGGHFWLNAGFHMADVPVDVYSMNGFQGQRVFIIPSHNMVIVRLGLTYKEGDFDFNQWVSSLIAAVE